MSTLDWFLVAWWLLTPAAGILAFKAVWRQHRLSAEKAAEMHYFKRVPLGQINPSPGVYAPRRAQAAVVLSILSIAVLAAGWLVIIFNYDWARLWVLNLQILMIAFGVGVVVMGLTIKMPLLQEDGTEGWFSKKFPRLVRSVFVLFGIAATATGATIAIHDIAQPRLVVEGHVDSVSPPKGWFSDSEYRVVIDGKGYRSTFQAFVEIHPGRRVRVEIGAGSSMIFASDAEARRAASRAVRN